jgi:PAS domain S-box-containing protein
MRILLVEDNPDHRELMSIALTEYNAAWQVDGVESGDKALRLLLGGEMFDLVFVDYSLPGRDGLEVLEEIRQGEAPPPVVVVTGRGDEQVAVKAMKSGAYDYVVKGEGYLQRLPVVALRALEAHQLAIERKRAVKALRESEERLRTVIEASLDAIIAVNVEGRLVLFNGAAQELFQYSEEEALNQPVEILLREEIGEIHQERLVRFLKKGVGRCGHIGRRTEKLFRRKDGSLFEAEVSMSGGRLDGLRLVVLSIHDITERKQAEEKIRASLREKELLLREIHHRVKNNMQVISGLLDLQASSSKNPELIAMFQESQSRIQAMSLVHEKLYGSNDFARIDLADYVKSLSQDLFRTYKINPGKIDLIVQPDGDVYVNINKAIPCGLILNELISNALKHAFSRDRHGELQIIIRETKNTEIEIVVRDNGGGLPDDVDIHQPRTVGLHLVNGLVKNQLDGQIEVRRDNGTEFRIKIPL